MVLSPHTPLAFAFAKACCCYENSGTCGGGCAGEGEPRVEEGGEEGEEGEEEERWNADGLASAAPTQEVALDSEEPPKKHKTVAAMVPIELLRRMKVLSAADVAADEAWRFAPIGVVGNHERDLINYTHEELRRRLQHVAAHAR